MILRVLKMSELTYIYEIMWATFLHLCQKPNQQAIFQVFGLEDLESLVSSQGKRKTITLVSQQLTAENCGTHESTNCQDNDRGNFSGGRSEI